MALYHKEFNPSISKAVAILEKDGKHGMVEARKEMQKVLDVLCGTDLKHSLGELHRSLQSMRHNINKAYRKTKGGADKSEILTCLRSAESDLDLSLDSIKRMFEEEVELV